MESDLSNLALKILNALYEWRVTALAILLTLLTAFFRAYRDWVDQPADAPRKRYLYFLFGLLIQVFARRVGAPGGMGQLSGRVAKLEDLLAQVLARLPPTPAPVSREDPVSSPPHADVAAGSPAGGA